MRFEKPLHTEPDHVKIFRFGDFENFWVFALWENLSYIRTLTIEKIPIFEKNVNILPSWAYHFKPKIEYISWKSEKMAKNC